MVSIFHFFIIYTNAMNPTRIRNVYYILKNSLM